MRPRRQTSEGFRRRSRARSSMRRRPWSAHVGGNRGGNEVGTNAVIAWPRVSARVRLEVAYLQPIRGGNRDCGVLGRPPTEPKVRGSNPLGRAGSHGDLAPVRATWLLRSTRALRPFQRHDLHDTHARLRRVTHRTRAESAWITWYPANCVQRVLALVGVRGVYPAGGEG